MTRKSLALLGLALTVWMGMNVEGCDAIGPGTSIDGRTPPALLAEYIDASARRMRFDVDLRNYPDAVRISWEFGDGSALNARSISTQKVVSHQFANDGTFTVRAYLFSAGDPVLEEPASLLGIAELPVSVAANNRAPTARFTSTDVVGDDDNPISLTKRFNAASSSDPDGTIASYEWEFGDGATDTGVSVDHEYARAGRYPVRLTVTDNDGETASFSLIVLVNSTPGVSFTATEDSNNRLRFNFVGEGTLDGEEAADQLTFTWDFGDGSDEEQGVSVSHLYAVPDDYTVTLTVRDSLGNSATANQVVDVTGSEPFVRSSDTEIGEVDSVVTDVAIEGENFEDGATATLVQGSTRIEATTTTFISTTSLLATFDLSGAALGTYMIEISNPDGNTATLTSGIRVVTDNRVRITTSLGEIVVELVDDAPITTENFLQYVEDDFYDGTIFHRVVPDFVVQGGGFLPGMTMQDGIRDPIMNEFSADRSNLRGTVAMAKLGGDPDSATSQFFFNLDDNSENLDNQNGGFTVFAEVVEGLDVVDAISEVDLNGEVPVDDVLLINAERI